MEGNPVDLSLTAFQQMVGVASKNSLAGHPKPSGHIQQRMPHGHHLFQNLALAGFVIIHGALAHQGKSSTAYRATLTCFEKMFAKRRRCPRKTSVGRLRFRVERRDGGFRPVHISRDSQQNVVRILGLLPVIKRVQLEHQQRPNP